MWRGVTPSWGTTHSGWALGAESQFSSVVWLLLDWSCSSEWPHVHAYKGSPIWTQWGIQLQGRHGFWRGMWGGGFRIWKGKAKRWIWSKFILCVYMTFSKHKQNWYIKDPPQRQKIKQHNPSKDFITLYEIDDIWVLLSNDLRFCKCVIYKFDEELVDQLPSVFCIRNSLSTDMLSSMLTISGSHLTSTMGNTQSWLLCGCDPSSVAYARNIRHDTLLIKLIDNLKMRYGDNLMQHFSMKLKLLV